MPLLDHFHPPLSERRRWSSFFNSWTTYLSSQLNALLPAGYVAEANVRFGVEIDVATFEEPGATLPTTGWIAPPPRSSSPMELPGAVVEIGIFSKSGGLLLAGAIERFADIHRELLIRLGVDDPGAGPALSGSAYRPVGRSGATVLGVWREPIAVGQVLPTLPLWLRGGLCLPVELEATYERTCVEQRVQPAA